MKRITLVTGHYGCGKTNLSVNLALAHSKEKGSVTLVDLDIVNPYFRSSDYRQLLESSGVHVISPSYADTNLDLPALPAEIFSVFDSGVNVIIDVGGDDAGATALGRFRTRINPDDCELLYVINRRRAQTSTPAQAAELLHEIETASRLKATAVVNNTHLKELTTAEIIRESLPFAKETAALLGLPLAFTTAPKALASQLSDIENLFPVDIIVKTPWE